MTTTRRGFLGALAGVAAAIGIGVKPSPAATPAPRKVKWPPFATESEYGSAVTSMAGYSYGARPVPSISQGTGGVVGYHVEGLAHRIDACEMCQRTIVIGREEGDR
jgi:hypothetical protein